MSSQTRLLTLLLVFLTITSTLTSVFLLPAKAGEPPGDTVMKLSCVGVIPSTPDCINDTLQPFESIVYDLDENNVYSGSDVVIVGPQPQSGAALLEEPNIRYRDTVTPQNNFWEPGEAIFYDQDGDVGTTGDRVFLIGAATVLATLVKDDPLIKYVETSGNGRFNGVVRVTARLEGVGGTYENLTREDLDAMQVIYTYDPIVLRVMRVSYPTGGILPDSSYTTTVNRHCETSEGSGLNILRADETGAVAEIFSSHLCQQGPPRTEDVGIGCDPNTAPGPCLGDGAGGPLQNLDVLRVQFMVVAHRSITLSHVIDQPGNPGSKILDIDGLASKPVPVVLEGVAFDNRKPGPPQPPVARFTTIPEKGRINRPVVFDGSGSSDPDGIVVRWDWDFGDETTGTGTTTFHTYTVTGDYNVILTVTDDRDLTNTTSHIITINPNQPPVATFTFTPSKGRVDRPIRFNATESEDPDGDITSFSWDFGDTTTGTGMVLSHTYTSAATYQVTLTVTDNDGTTATSIESIIVNTEATPPIADFNFTLNAAAGEPVSFDGRSSQDPDGTIQTYQWSFGDDTTGTGPTPTHTYNIPGDYEVTLTVTDDEAFTGAVTKAVTVLARLTVDSFTPNPSSGFVPLSVTFTASASGGLAPYSYTWDFGDTATTTTTTPVTTHNYQIPGTLTASLTVRDSKGRTAQASTQITVIGATLRITVQDPGGIPIEGATVRITTGPSAEGTEKTTGADGMVVFPDLLPGSYSFQVTAANFETITQTASLLAQATPNARTVILQPTIQPAPGLDNSNLLIIAAVIIVVVIGALLYVRSRRSTAPPDKPGRKK